MLLDPLKFFSIQFGSQSIFKEKGNEITAILKGEFTEPVLNKALDKFAEKFLICPKCKYPELDHEVKKKKVYGNCRACGNSCEVDNKHDFADYIVKHPPPKKKKPMVKPTDNADTIKTDPTAVRILY